MNLTRKEDREAILTSVVTDQDGLFGGDIDLRALALGKTTLTAVVDFSRSGIDITRIPKQILIPERDLPVDVQQIKAGLQIVESEDSELQNTFSLFAALLADKLTVKFAPPGPEDRSLIKVTIQMRNTPKTEQGFFFSYQKVFIAVEREGRNLYTYESPEVKDGGIRAEQAQNRTFNKLMEELQGNEDFVDAIQRAFSLH